MNWNLKRFYLNIIVIFLFLLFVFWLIAGIIMLLIIGFLLEYLPKNILITLLVIGSILYFGYFSPLINIVKNIRLIFDIRNTKRDITKTDIYSILLILRSLNITILLIIVYSFLSEAF